MVLNRAIVALTALLVLLVACTTRLTKAAEDGDTKTVLVLLDQGTSLDQRDSRGFTALMRAAYEGHVDTVRALIDRNADVNLRAGGLLIEEPALFWALQPDQTSRRSENVEVVKLLLAHGATVDDLTLEFARRCCPAITLLLEQTLAGGAPVSEGSDVKVEYKKSRLKEIETLLAQSRAAQREKNFPVALSNLRRAIRSDPKNPVVYREAAELLLLLCDQEGAEAVLKAGVAQASGTQTGSTSKDAQLSSPRHAGEPWACRVQTLNREGVALAKEKKLSEALEKFEIAAQAAPGLVPKVHYNAALILEQMGRPEEALRHSVTAQQSFLLPGDEMEVLTRLVALAQRQGIAVHESADRRYRVGILRAQQKRYQEAIQEFEAALTEAPWLVDAYYNLGLVYDFTGAYSDALRAMKTYSQLAPNAANIGTVKTKIVELEERLELLKTRAN